MSVQEVVDTYDDGLDAGALTNVSAGLGGLEGVIARSGWLLGCPRRQYGPGLTWVRIVCAGERQLGQLER